MNLFVPSTVALLLCALGAVAPVFSDRSVITTVQVTDSGKQPLKDVVFAIGVNGQAAKRLSDTDTAGQLIESVKVPDSPVTLVLRCGAPSKDGEGVFDKATEELTLARSVEKWYACNVDAQQTEVTKSVVMPLGVRVKGRVVGSDVSKGAVAGRTEGLSICLVGSNGNFEVGGFTPGQTGSVCVQVERQDRVLVVPVTLPANTSTSTVYTLPDVIWPSPTSAARSVSITVNNSETLGPLYGAIDEVVTLIDSTGNIQYTCAINPRTHKIYSAATSTEADLPKVEPGTYYIAMGDPILGGAERVLNRLRSVGPAGLEAMSWPKIVVPIEGSTMVETEVDAVSLWSKTLPLYATPR